MVSHAHTTQHSYASERSTEACREHTERDDLDELGPWHKTLSTDCQNGRQIANRALDLGDRCGLETVKGQLDRNGLT